MDTKGIVESLRTFAGEVVNRQIVTVLGAPSITGDIKTLNIQFTADGETKGIVTNINMLQADVTTSVHPDLAAGQFPEISALHDRMVELSTAVLERNVGILKGLAEWLGNRGEQPPG